MDGSPMDSGGWREDSLHVVFSNRRLRKASEEICFPSALREQISPVSSALLGLGSFPGIILHSHFFLPVPWYKAK